MTREDLIEAGARALYDEGEEGPSMEAEQRREGCRSLAEDVLDAIEPHLRAHERERVATLIAEGIELLMGSVLGPNHPGPMWIAGALWAQAVAESGQLR
jgi:hypothetical protein